MWYKLKRIMMRPNGVEKQIRPTVVGNERPDIDQYTSVSNASLVNWIHGIAVDEDGNNLYVCPASWVVSHYSLTWWDITTSTFIDSSNSIYTRWLYIKKEWDRLYSVSDNKRAYTIAMPTPFSLSGSTSSYTSISSLSAPCWCWFTPDWDYLFCVDYGDNSAYKIPLSTPRDTTTITSGTTSKSLWWIGALYNIAISPTWLKMFVGTWSSVGIYQYDLSTAWDITTAVYSWKSISVLWRWTFTVTKSWTIYQADIGNTTVYQYEAS